MAEDPKDWDIATKLIRGGLARSQYMETAEALYLTQGFTYDSAEGADRRFSGEDPGFVYSRFNNPTVKMFEDRLALLEGAANTLKRCRPRLAICVYHYPSDIPQISSYLKSLVPDYRFALRHHSPQLMETVLYAWAE